MKGKKADPEFVSMFIRQCAQQGMDTPDKILQQATQQVKDIDQQLMAIAEKRVLRSKLLDVIEKFDQVKDQSEDIRQLKLFTAT